MPKIERSGGEPTELEPILYPIIQEGGRYQAAVCGKARDLPGPNNAPQGLRTPLGMTNFSSRAGPEIYSRRLAPPLRRAWLVYHHQTSCFPWSIHEIDRKISAHPGKIIISVVTTVLLVIAIGAMVWSKVVRRRKLARNAGAQPPSDNSNAGESPLERTPTQTQVEVRTIDGPYASAVNL
ncbi:hypothetical protein BJ912DRAFT_1125006 [Pholiota molesta]|nr:hypothetical protein BJ912DRAFT_1125006 [Pholiota molesta]